MLPHISEFSSYLIDLDGVVYRGEQLVPGAQTFIDWLNASGKKYLFLTNNSFASETQVAAKLARLGIAADASHVLGAGQAAIKHIAHTFPDANVYIVGEQPLFDMAQTYKLRVVNHQDNPRIDVVLVGLDRHWSYERLNTAVLAVHGGAHFIAINRDPLLPVAQGFQAGTGTMVAAIEAGSGVSPEVVGKPKPMLLQEAMRTLESVPTETVMIGDSLGVDIQAGKAAGTRTLFVLSGKDSRASLEKINISPDYVYDNLSAVMDEIEGR